MGACEFWEIADGATAREAFGRAVEQARYEHGAGGYPGTIAEKHEFVMVSTQVMSREAAHALSNRLLDERDPRVHDKWGPAGCIALSTPGRWLFFGWASS